MKPRIKKKSSIIHKIFVQMHTTTHKPSIHRSKRFVLLATSASANKVSGDGEKAGGKRWC